MSGPSQQGSRSNGRQSAFQCRLTVAWPWSVVHKKYRSNLCPDHGAGSRAAAASAVATDVGIQTERPSFSQQCALKVWDMLLPPIGVYGICHCPGSSVGFVARRRRSNTHECCRKKHCRVPRQLSAAAGRINQTTAASSMRVATRLTTVRLPCPAFETLLVVTRLWLSSSATSRRTAEGSRAKIRAKALNVTGSVEISRNRRTRAGVITSKKSAGSSKER